MIEWLEQDRLQLGIDSGNAPPLSAKEEHIARANSPRAMMFQLAGIACFLLAVFVTLGTGSYWWIALGIAAAILPFLLVPSGPVDTAEAAVDRGIADPEFYAEILDRGAWLYVVDEALATELGVEGTPSKS